MKLYIDGDALPNLLKPILLRAIEKQNIILSSFGQKDTQNFANAFNKFLQSIEI